MRRPASHIVGEFFQQSECALTPPLVDGIGDITAWNEHSGALLLLGDCSSTQFASSIDSLIANQVTDIGHHPLLAGFNKPVLVELGNVRLYDVYLLGNHAQESFQRQTLLCITAAVDCRQKVI